MKKWIFGISIIIVAVVLYGAYLYNTTMENKLPEKSKTVEIAKEKGKLTEVTDIDYYHGTTSYTVVQGLDEKGDQYIVWVPEEKGDVLVRKKSDGISEQEAVQIVEEKEHPKEIVKVKLGAENNVPLWEVTYIDQEDRYTYYYLEFKDGKYAGYYSIEK